MSDITVSVTVPDGLPVPKVTVWLRPDAEEQFEEYMEALGGILAARLNSSAFVVFEIGDGVEAFLYLPPEIAPPKPAVTPQSAFLASLAKRQREARDLMARLEIAAAQDAERGSSWTLEADRALGGLA